MQTIHLTQNNFKLFPTVYMVQNDTGRELKMILDDVTLDGTETGSVAIRRSDGSYYTISATLVAADNAFTAEMDQALTQPGQTECQLKVTSSSEVVSTYTFIVFVQESTNGVPEEQLGYSVEDIMNAVNTVIRSDGLTPMIKDAILDCFKNVAWTNSSGQYYYDALELALYPPANLVSIDAVFTQGSVIITNENTLDDLRQYLVVTANYDDSTSEVVSNYTLSGELTSGDCTITASYAGKSDNFVVNVTYIDRSVVYLLTEPTAISGTNKINTNVAILSSNSDCTIRAAIINTKNSGRHMATDDPSVSFSVRQYSATSIGATFAGTEQSFTAMSNLDNTKEIRTVFTHAAGTNTGTFYLSYYNTNGDIITDTITVTGTFTPTGSQILFGGLRISAQSIEGTINKADIRTRVMTNAEITAFLQGDD